MHKTTSMRGTTALIATATILLTACQTPPSQVAVYDFGAMPTAAVAVAGATRLPPIALTPIQASGAWDNASVLYRLNYANPHQLMPYTQSRWTMPVPQLLHQRLQHYLGQNRAVLQPIQGVNITTGTLRLHGEVEEFSHWFETPQNSQGVVRMVVTLGRVQNGGKEEFIAQRRFTAERTAPSPDAAGGITALTQASDTIIAEIAQWVDVIQSTNK